MNLEIERKFLAREGWKKGLRNPKVLLIEQGYLTKDLAGNVVRIRTTDDGGLKTVYLCIKGERTEGGTPEFEYEIPLSEAAALMRLCNGRTIKKRRYHVEYGDHLYEVDEFLGEHEGLTLIELELFNPQEEVVYPAWVGREVTDDHRYTNAWMSVNGRP